MLPNVEIKDITELNDTFLAYALIVTEKLNIAICYGNQQPGWKERLLRKVERLKVDMSQIFQCRKRPCEDGIRKRLEKKIQDQKKKL